MRFDAQTRTVFVIFPSSDSKDVSPSPTTTNLFAIANLVCVLHRICESPNDVTALEKFKGAVYSSLVSVEDDNDFAINLLESVDFIRFQLIARSPQILICPFRSLAHEAKQVKQSSTCLDTFVSFTGFLTENKRADEYKSEENENVLRWHLKVKSVEIYFGGSASKNEENIFV